MYKSPSTISNLYWSEIIYRYQFDCILVSYITHFTDRTDENSNRSRSETDFAKYYFNICLECNLWVESIRAEQFDKLKNM